MTTYLILNVLFLFTLIMFIPKQLKKPSRAWVVTLVGLMLLTAIFDPLIILADIVNYDSTKILDVRFFGAPIENFFYAVYAACAVPLIWTRLGENPRYKENDKQAHSSK